MMRALVLAALLLPLVSAGTEPHAVVLLYHHVDDSTPASTSVSPQVFEQHLDWLEEHDYEVWPLERLVRAFVDGAEETPNRVVAKIGRASCRERGERAGRAGAGER